MLLQGTYQDKFITQNVNGLLSKVFCSRLSQSVTAGDQKRTQMLQIETNELVRRHNLNL